MKHQFHRTINTTLLIALTTILSMASAASASVGVVKIDGTTVPEVHFEAFRLNYLPDQYKCSYEAARNGAIDSHVLYLVSLQRHFRRSKNAERNLNILNKQIAKVSESDDLKRAKLELEKMTFPRSILMKHLGYELTDADIETEYKNRVELQDPKLINVQVYKTLKIGHFRDDAKIVEAAKLIESGMPFEAVAEKIPSDQPRLTGSFKDLEKDVENAWYTIDAINGYDGDGTDLVPGYIVGLDELLEDNDAAVYSLTKIVDTKVIAQVTDTDLIVSSIKSKSPYYYWGYIKEHANDWKYAQFMNTLWSEFEITENGLPIQRFHFYADCKPLF